MPGETEADWKQANAPFLNSKGQIDTTHPFYTAWKIALQNGADLYKVCSKYPDACLVILSAGLGAAEAQMSALERAALLRASRFIRSERTYLMFATTEDGNLLVGAFSRCRACIAR
jgi:hypothetical protein